MKKVWYEILIDLICHIIEWLQAAAISDIGATDVQVIKRPRCFP